MKLLRFAGIITVLFCILYLWDTVNAVDKPAPIALSAEEVKALDDTVKAETQVNTQLNNIIQQATQLAVEPTVSMQFHSQVKDLMNQRSIIAERFRALKAEHRLAHNCPTCEYDGHNLVPKEGK